MDIMESLSVGRYSGTQYFQSHLPGKLGRPWSADKTGYGTVFCGELYNDILQNVIEHPLQCDDLFECSTNAKSGDCSRAVCGMVLCGVHFWFVVHFRFRETISGLTLLSE